MPLQEDTNSLNARLQSDAALAYGKALRDHKIRELARKQESLRSVLTLMVQMHRRRAVFSWLPKFIKVED